MPSVIATMTGTHRVLKGVLRVLTGALTGCAARYFYDVQSPWLETDVARESGSAVELIRGRMWSG